MILSYMYTMYFDHVHFLLPPLCPLPHTPRDPYPVSGPFFVFMMCGFVSCFCLFICFILFFCDLMSFIGLLKGA